MERSGDPRWMLPTTVGSAVLATILVGTIIIRATTSDEALRFTEEASSAPTSTTTAATTSTTITSTTTTSAPLQPDLAGFLATAPDDFAEAVRGLRDAVTPQVRADAASESAVVLATAPVIRAKADQLGQEMSATIKKLIGPTAPLPDTMEAVIRLKDALFDLSSIQDSLEAVTSCVATGRDCTTERIASRFYIDGQTSVFGTSLAGFSPICDEFLSLASEIS